MTIPNESRVTEDQTVREEVFRHFTHKFGLSIHSYVPVFLGLYNMKWIVTTSSGKLFIKCYHPKRYKLTESSRYLKIARSLSFQHLLSDLSGVCPGVWVQEESEGSHICQSESGHFYVVMEYFDGKPLLAGQVESSIMYKLGKNTGKMHQVLSRFPMDGEAWSPSLTDMSEKWLDNRKKALERNTPAHRASQAIERQGLIMSDLDVSMFDVFQPGWAHWDLWVDNMLVRENGEVKFVDFDTVQFAYSEIDVARGLLSCALHGGELRPEPAGAFLAGYREERPFQKGLLPLALKLVWCREAHWWLKTDMDDFSVPIQRFAEEMIWLTDRWWELDELYGEW
ncbi:phosphotransferase enzyme family protein [Paenibacillus eucommiae]|uniref:Homoserine kinase type II n=1 Tax=Paenibacillus eucommiae TaxID=1355755 RepID=A0ABS4IWD3_9BACL|nr:phosphotransferase [Paenibacillus eucommiae]MBP1991899.1 homoserine kinase type II [Paenibacillus eucommiae]